MGQSVQPDCTLRCMTPLTQHANMWVLASGGETWREVNVESHSKPVRFVLCSECISLECECGERLILIGREEDWHSTGRTDFECECGNKLTLDNNRVEVQVGSSAMT
jgi:hypothetical protein